VIDAGPDDNPPWLATSYVPGPSLQDAVTRHGPLPEPAIWRLAAGLAEALQAVHARGLVHRDLKPSNVLLAADGPRVIDFGIARALDGTQLTTAGFALGTPGYMAPEQASGQPAVPASDVFALGSVLCFSATGDAPFGDGEPPAVLYRVVTAEPALESVPTALRGLIAGCLAKDPADRPTPAQVLRGCQAQAPQLGGPAALFWPGQVAALILRHQAGLDDAARPPGPAGDPAGESLVEPTQTITGDLVTPERSVPPASVGERDNRAGRSAGPVSRRRALAGLAAAGVAAGLGVGGWAYARSRSRSGSGSGSGRPAAPSQLLWARETGGPVSSGAALAGGILYIGSNDGKVHAFEAASGRPVRTFPTSGAVTGGVVVTGGTLFAGSADHSVHAFRVAAGGHDWTYRTNGQVNCTPAVAGGTVFIGSDDGSVYALHAGTGRSAWRYGTGGPVRSGPQPGGPGYSGYVFVAGEDGYLYGLGTDGKLQWRFAVGAPVTAGLAFGLSIVCAGDAKGRVVGVDGDGPSVHWERSVGGAVRGQPALAGQILYVGSAGSTVDALRLYGGAQDWSYPTAGPVGSGLAVDDAGVTVYAGDDDGYVYAIDTASLSARWRYRAGAAVRSQLLLANGVVYFGSDDHHVYALRA
jgi:outer membrane protein assembly factor BamB